MESLSYDTKNPVANLADFKNLMFDKLIPIKNLKDKDGEPLNKLLFFWRRKNLIPFIEPGKWLKISFVQLLWIRILDDLREISFPVEKMKLVCDYFYKDAHEADLPKKNIEYNYDLLKKKDVAGTLTDEEKKMLQYLCDFLKDPMFLEILKYDINYLTNLIIRSIAKEENVTILIFFDGMVAESQNADYVSHRQDYYVDITKPHIRLTLTNYLKEFLEDEVLSTLFVPQLLNEDEQKVLTEMRKKNVKEIVIYNNNNGEPIRIESTESGVITSEQARQIKQILGLKNYERITLDTIDDKSLSFRKTRKKI